MHLLKRIFSATTGYWIHKISTLPVGTDLFVDIHKRINYGEMKTIFDVGASIGQTWALFRTNEPDAKVYCFEPISETFNLLRQKVGTDNKTKIENIALGNIKGEKIIRLFEKCSPLNSLKEELMNNRNDAIEETVIIDTIDEYCKAKNITTIDFLKIDTEGYDLEVLRGAEEMLSNALVPFIYCEIGILKKNNRNTNFSELTDWLAERDYHFFGLYQLVANGWKQGDYFGNALYVHKDIYNP